MAPIQLNYSADTNVLVDVAVTNSPINWTNTTDYYGGTSAIDALTTLDNMCNSLDLTTVRPPYALAFNIILPIVCFCGIVGSLFTVTVLSQKGMRTSTNIYLIALTSADLIFLILLTSGQFQEMTYVNHEYRIYFIYSIIFLHISLLASIWITVALAVERYIAICHPLQASNMCTIFRARCVIIIVFVLAFICRAPQFWEHKIVHYYDKCEERQVNEVEETELTFNRDYLTAFLWIIDGAVTAIIPFLALFYLNIRLIMEVRRSSRYLSLSLSTGSTARYVISREEVQITIMLISIVTVFFICEVPIVMFTAISGIYRHYAEQPIAGLFDIMSQVTRLLAAIKCTLNFILYCWFSEKFWLTFKSMFCVKYCMKKCKSKRALTSRQSSYTNGTATSFLKRSSKDASRETSAM